MSDQCIFKRVFGVKCPIENTIILSCESKKSENHWNQGKAGVQGFCSQVKEVQIGILALVQLGEAPPRQI